MCTSLRFLSSLDLRGVYPTLLLAQVMQGVAMEESLAELRETFRSGRTRSVPWRKKQLGAIIDMLKDEEEKLFQALHLDLGKAKAEAYRDEIGVLMKSATLAFSSVEKWAAPKRGSLPLLFFPTIAEVLPEPYGVVLIFSAWNMPISLALDPLIGAICAGNTVALKPSEQAPACASLLAEILPFYLDDKAVKVIQGGPDACEQLLELKWDKIFFTGSTRVGRIVMTAAVKHLTPVTLELGGKCPAILDTLSSPSEIKLAVKRIAGAKWGPCAGQACIAIDYVLVEEKFAPTVIDLLKKFIKKFFGDDPKDLKCISRIVNKKQFERLRNLLNDPGVKASTVYGGSLDEQNLLIEPTILLDPPLDAEIMKEEIFGPLLPIITLENIQEAIEFINSRPNPNPLAIYAFTNDETLKRKIVSETSSGSVTFNDVLIHYLCDAVPFGGVGQSGFGRYHGKYSFECFSHEKAVIHRRFILEIPQRYPPWNDFKLQFIRLAYRFDYLGLLLLLLGLKRR